MNKIVEKVALSENVVKIILEAPAIARKRRAGQFIVLLMDEKGERIPLMIVDSDPERGTITIIFQVIGKTTAAMAGMKVGDHFSDVQGPLGNPTDIKKIGQVVCIGGGNVAMDSVRTALRLGAENAYIIYRRTEVEMPARKEEVHHAHEEGVQFRLLTNPVEYIGNENGWVTGMKCIRMELGEPDASGRRSPVPVEGSEFVIDVDTVVVAVGTMANPIVPATTPGLETNRRGYIITKGESGETTRPGVYAGGDIVTGSATVILAMGAGKQAARAIHAHLSGK